MKNILEYYAICANIVRTWPDVSLDYMKPKTFAVLYDKAQLNLDNLGKNVNYQDQPFFFSASWEGSGSKPPVSFEFPLIAVARANWEGIDIRKKKVSQNNTVDLYVIDKLPLDDDEDDPKSQRTTEQVERDLEKILFQFISQLLGYRYIEGVTTAGDIETWVHEDWIELKKSSGFLGTHEVKYDIETFLLPDITGGTFVDYFPRKVAVLSSFSLQLLPCENAGDFDHSADMPNGKTLGNIIDTGPYY